MIATQFAEQVEETVAYRGGEAVADSDGFPLVDDIQNRPFGQYRLGRLLGHGSMGRVYKAQHMGLLRPCAIKVMNPGLVKREPQVHERFWAEARAVANLAHPNVVTVHNLGSDRGYHFIEMEYISGGRTLRDGLVHEGAFEPVKASCLVRQVVEALGAAHKAGLVHRDIKPSNVLLTPSGLAKLADFGLVRRISELDGLGNNTVAGSPTFMAPELFSGVAASARSDLYAVGVMYYYLLSARLPFTADRVIELIRQHRNVPAPDIRIFAPDVPESVVAILKRCLAKLPDNRYETAGELSEDLRLVISGLRDPDTLIKESLAGVDCLIQGGADNYRLVFPLPGDRIHEVYLEFHESGEGERLLTVFGVCAPAKSMHHEFALKLNSELTHGAISIRTIGGESMYVMTRTFAREHVRPEEIRATMLEIARQGDLVEQRLTNNSDLY
ncbi:serine/threonine-protein kinase [Isosphaeraceae bacterium EP7]